MSAALDPAAVAGRSLESLTRLERKWLKRRYCGFCEISCLASKCESMCGEYELPVIEGVRDEPETVDLGPPCNMDERRAMWLESYKPHAHLMEIDDAEK